MEVGDRREGGHQGGQEGTSLEAGEEGRTGGGKEMRMAEGQEGRRMGGKEGRRGGGEEGRRSLQVALRVVGGTPLIVVYPDALCWQHCV